MGVFNRLAFAALAVALAAPRAFGAEPIAYPLSTAAELPVHDDARFDWSGFYAGLYGVGRNSSAGGGQYGLGINLGVNAAVDFYLVGAEVAFQGLQSGAGDTTYADLLARGGLLVTEDVLVYAVAGYGVDTGALAQSDILLGAGAEFAVTDTISLRAQYLHGFPVTGGNDKDEVTLGASFHF